MFDGADFGDLFGSGGGSWAEGMGGAAESWASHGWDSAHSWSSAKWGEADGLLGRILGSSEGAIGEAFEGILSRFGKGAANVLSEYLDYEFYSRVSDAVGGGHSHKSWEKWHRAGGAAQNEELAQAAEAIKSHSLILEQLHKHAPNSELLEKYAALGINLPGEDLLKEAKRTLSIKLYPREIGQDDTLMKAVNNALDVLKDRTKTEPYRNLLAKAGNNQGLREKIEGFFKDFSGKQSEFYEQAAMRAKLLLSFQGKSREKMNTAEKISHSIHEGFVKRGQLGRGAIIFSAVAGTSFLAYYLATRKDKSKKAHGTETHVEKLSKDKPQTAIAL